MMKKQLFLLLLCFMAVGVNASVSQSQESLNLSVGLIDPTKPEEGNHRTPMQPPHVFIDGHTLFMQYVPFDVTLEILDGSGSVVYTTFVAAYTPSVTLPSTLSGDYQIRLIEGYWYFYGWIHL